MPVILCLADFTQHDALTVHPLMQKADFLLFNGYYSIIQTSISSLLYPFIRKWTLGLLSCLGSLNDTAGMWVRISLPESDFISFRYIPRSGTAGSYGSFIFNFSGTFILFPIVAAPICTHINSVKWFSFLHILTNTCYVFDESHSDRDEVVI